MSPFVVKLLMWFLFTIMFQVWCTKFKEKHPKTFESAGMDFAYISVKFGIPALLMNMIGLAREINVWLGIVS